jgi:Flp pilus assembly protein TadG
MTHGSGRRRHPTAEAGQSLAEMAIAIVLFVSLTFGIVDAGRLILAYNVVSSGAREGVRWAAVRGGTSGRTVTAADVASFVQSMTVGTPVNVTATWDPDNQPGSTVAVTVASDFAPVARFPGVPRVLNLSSTSRMVISR